MYLCDTEHLTLGLRHSNNQDRDRAAALWFSLAGPSPHGQNFKCCDPGATYLL